MQPRLIRLRDAPTYLGMDRNRFNNEVRPFLITLKIGRQGIAFDRIDLDHWADEFKKHQGCPPQQTLHWQYPPNQHTLINEKNKSFTKNNIEEKFQQLVDRVLKKNRFHLLLK